MSYQYVYCPTCATRRVAYGYRCSVCDGLVPRTPPTRVHADPMAARTLLSWPSNAEPVQAGTAERQPLAA